MADHEIEHRVPEELEPLVVFERLGPRRLLVAPARVSERLFQEAAIPERVPEDPLEAREVGGPGLVHGTFATVEALRERFGKYHVLEKIAQGGMAEVYKVKTVGIAGFEKIQALKRILPRSAREGRFIRSFIDEARIAVELTHRNIVQVFDFGKADGELFLAMELIEGKDLRTAMTEAASRGSPAATAVAAYIVSEVAAGLDYAHRKTDLYGGPLSIVHCDVSPSNVMLSGDGYVKILDFGIARATFASALERRRLRGKPRYMAPEQTLGEPPTPAADVFALGIIAWELFTGMPLYQGPSVKAILESIRTVVPHRIDAIVPTIPREIAEAVAVALSREPSERGSAADLGAACVRTAMAAGPRAVADWLLGLDDGRGSRRMSRPTDGDALLGAPLGHAPTMTPGERPSVTVISPPLRPSLLAIDAAGDAQAKPLSTRRAIDAIAEAERSRTAGLDPRLVADQGHLPSPFVREPTMALEPPVRPSYDALTFASALAPAGYRADDEITQHREPVRVVVPSEPPSVVAAADDAAVDPDVLEVEPDALEVEADAIEAAHDVLQDEAIDDDIPALLAPLERRRAVVIAAVLSGGPPDVLRPLGRSLGELAYQRGGVVTAQDDQAVEIAFGLEVAGDDDLDVAMGWALDAMAMVRDAADDPGTGMHAIRDLAGLDGGVELRIGARADVEVAPDEDGLVRVPTDAALEARVLAGEAPPDRPRFAGASTWSTNALYEVLELPRTARGRTPRVIELLGARGIDDRRRAGVERQGLFVGRDAELAALEGWFDRAIAEDRRVVALVTGAVGTGKSRLIAELAARHATRAPIRVVRAVASPDDRYAPFALVIDLYQAALAVPTVRGRSGRATLIHRASQVLSRAGVSAEVARTVAIDLDRALELRDGIGVGAPEVADLRPRISAGLATFRLALADRDRPLLMILEDLHLADSASLEVLRHALAIPQHGPELLVLTARPDGPIAPADVAISIDELSGGDLRQLVADRLVDHATPAAVAAVIARAGGNPLFVDELARAIREGGGELPASAREVIMQRYERLTAGAQAVLRFAAVLGDRARVRLLEELEPALGEPDTAGLGGIYRDLEEVVEGGWLARTSDGDLEFARGLYREVLLRTMSNDQQRACHLAVGRLLASRFFAGRAEPPAVTALHLERGGDTTGAAAFWLRAGHLAHTASDADAAVACYARTLALEVELGAVPPTPASRARRRQAFAGREEAHRLRGDLVSDATDLDELERLSDDDSGRLADVAIRRAHRFVRWGDYDAAMAATAVADEHAAAAGDDRMRGEALRIRAEILERLGRFDEALQLVDGARELAAQAGAVTDEMAAMIGRGRIHLLRADYEGAHVAYHPVLALIERTGDPWLERIVTNHVAVIEMCLGDFTRAMACARRSLELCRRYGDRGREGDALSVCGIILAQVGLYDHAASMFAEALELLARTASRWSRADCLIHAGMCEVRRGQVGGMRLLDEALEEARGLGVRYLEANALIARAGAKVHAGELQASIEDSSAGAEAARQAGLSGYEIRALARQAVAIARLGSHPELARDLADHALSLFDDQRYLEGAEEEVYAACVEVLRATGALDRAELVRERGRASARRKLDLMIDPAWRSAYVAIPEIRDLLA